MEKKDPIESTPQFKAIKRKIERDVKAAMEKDGLPSKAAFMGWCYHYWGYKKEILKSKYGIEWKSPDEMNPNILYD